MATGRFAPSPTGDLHVGNLRTGLLASLSARASGGRFVLRFEDLDTDRSDRRWEDRQRRDLADLGLGWDEEHRQSDTPGRYRAALRRLEEAGLTYRCWCTRREIREAASAPHTADGPPGAYPGTCRDLGAAARAERERSERPWAVRLRSDGRTVEVRDRLRGECSAVLDDLVLLRNDGTPAYQLAVVVDDAAQGIEEVVRADDLLDSTPRQAALADLLGLPRPSWAHVPLVLGPDGTRLAKRHGAVTLADLRGLGWDGGRLRAELAVGLGLAEPGERPSADDLAARFDPASLPRDPWVFSAPGRT